MFNSLIELSDCLKITPETCSYQTFLHRTEVTISPKEENTSYCNKNFSISTYLEFILIENRFLTMS